ncbi:M-phase inducer phosphatase-like [Centruroides vittatus]|uniref:M-phase inducer phosphatase-like n=1 Tax=Centruroides vittatus TaxID=120091 RepID=UPI0035108914
MSYEKENRFSSLKLLNEGNEISPVTNLTNNLGNLSTFNFMETPKRILTFTDSPNIKLSHYSNVVQGSNSPLCLNSPGNQERVFRVININNEENKAKVCSNIKSHHPYSGPIYQDKEIYSKQFRTISEHSHGSVDSGYIGTKSEELTSNCSISTSYSSLVSNDDGFLNELDDKFDENSEMPFMYTNLISKPLIISTAENSEKNTDASTFESCSVKSTLPQNEDKKLEESSSSSRHNTIEVRTCNKRLEAETLSCPINYKRRRDTKNDKHCKRSISLNEAAIMNALQRSIQEPDLIGDFSKPYALPLVEGNDLKNIIPETVAQLIRGYYQDIVKSYIIIDCRYPYEYEGGHIKGSRNIYTKDSLCSEFLSGQKADTQIQDRNILIFHCEFSSERGPDLCRFLRKKDREINNEVYPNLHYPEMYIIKGGYKAFFENFKELCEPPAYKPMLHKEHEGEFRRFRQQKRTFHDTKRSSARTGLKF